MSSDLLLQLLDAAEDAGDVDARQLADALGVTPAALRRVLAEPAALSADHAAIVGAALGVDRGVLRALRREGPRVGERRADGVASGPATGVAGLLEAVLRGIAADATGLALRVALLDAAADAARAARRPLPPAAHELRARLTRGEVPDETAGSDLEAVAGGGPDGGDVAQDDVALVAAAADVVRDLQRAEPGYDGLFAPLADEGCDALLRRFGIVSFDAVGVGATARFVLTPALFGRHRLVWASSARPDQRRLVARAAIAHVAAGHVGETRPLSAPAPEPAARLADVVALADLVPFWLLADLRRRGRLGWRALTDHVAALATCAAGDWPAVRTSDRAALRVALFRAHDV